MGFKSLNLSQEIINKIIELYQGGMGSKKIGKEIGISAFSVINILEKNGIPITKSKRGEVVKITEKDYDNIKFLYEGGMSTDDIGGRYDVSRARVRQVLDKIGVVQRHVLFGKHRKHPINKDFFKVIDTEEKAYILGFLYADGTVSAVNQNTRIGLSSKDEDHIIKIAKFIHLSDPNFLIKRRISKEGYKSSYIDFHSIDIKNDLIALGCTPRKSKTIKFPKLNDDMVRHFMRGYFDGDGSIYAKEGKHMGEGTGVISTVEFIQYWNRVLKHKLDINTHIRIYDERIWISEVSGRHQNRRLLDFLYEGSTISLDRKYERYQLMCEEMKRALTRPMKEYTIKEGYPSFEDNEIVGEIIKLTEEEKIIWSNLLKEEKGLPFDRSEDEEAIEAEMEEEMEEEEQTNARMMVV